MSQQLDLVEYMACKLSRDRNIGKRKQWKGICFCVKGCHFKGEEAILRNREY